MREHSLYTESMSKSIWDKGFFMDKIENATAVIDYGCADGAMIRFLGKLFPWMQFYGYDMDDEMIALARKQSVGNNVSFFSRSQLSDLIESVQRAGHASVCLNLSSVLHEVYSFPENRGMDCISEIVRQLPVTYITIRDMYYHTDCMTIPESKLDVILKVDAHYVADFNKKFGSIDQWKNLIHFLMKYQWTRNGWDEEMKENYFSWSMDQLLEDLPFGFRVIYENHYLLPHLCYRWYREYGIFIPYIHTHAQFILTR